MLLDSSTWVFGYEDVDLTALDALAILVPIVLFLGIFLKWVCCGRPDRFQHIFNGDFGDFPLLPVRIWSVLACSRGSHPPALRGDLRLYTKILLVWALLLIGKVVYAHALHRTCN